MKNLKINKGALIICNVTARDQKISMRRNSAVGYLGWCLRLKSHGFKRTLQIKSMYNRARSLLQMPHIKCSYSSVYFYLQTITCFSQYNKSYLASSSCNISITCWLYIELKSEPLNVYKNDSVSLWKRSKVLHWSNTLVKRGKEKKSIVCSSLTKRGLSKETVLANKSN